MASQEEISALIQDYTSLFLGNYCGLILATFVGYEHVVTLGEEIRLFWSGKFSGATVLFLLNRYSNLIFVFFEMISCFIHFSDTVISLCELILEEMSLTSMISCERAGKAMQMVGNVQDIVLATFSGVRVYALSRNRPLAALVSLLYMVPAVLTSMYFFFHITGVNIPPFGCVVTDDMPMNLQKTVITADTIIIFVTWYKLRGDRGSLSTLSRESLAHVLLRNGVIYFALLLFLNLLHLSLTMLSYTQPLSGVSYVSIFTNPLTSVLVSRLLLDLQAVHQQSAGIGSLNGTHVDSLVFARMIGSLGASVKIEDAHLGPHDHDYLPEIRCTGGRARDASDTEWSAGCAVKEKGDVAVEITSVKGIAEVDIASPSSSHSSNLYS